MRYSPKYLYKYGIFIVAAAILFFFFGINWYLAKQKNGIEQEFSRQFKQKISIGSFKYFPPNFLILDNVSISNDASSKNNLSSSIKKVELTFSLSNLINKKAFIITGLSLLDPQIDFPSIPQINLIEYFFSVCADIKQFIVALSPLVDQSISKFNIKRGNLSFPESIRPLKNISINTFEINKKGLIASKGAANLEAFSFESGASQSPNPNSVDYDFSGHFAERGIVVDGLKLKKANFYSKLWGDLDNEIVALKGFAFFGNFSDYLASGDYKGTDIVAKLKNIVPHNQDSGVIWLSSFGNFNIYNFDCSLKFDPSSITIDNLSFYLNNTPFFLNGKMSFSQKTSINLKLIFYRNVSSNPLKERSKFETELKGELDKGRFSGNVSFDYPLEINNKIVSETIKTDFKDLILFLTKDKHIKISFKAADFYYNSAETSRKFNLRKFGALCTYKNKNLKFVYGALLYDGIMKGSGVIDSRSIPFKRFLGITIKKVSVGEIVPVINYLSPFSGKVDANIDIRNWPQSHIAGNVSLNEGTVENLKFLTWFEQFFGSQLFKRIDFQNLSMKFLFNDKRSDFTAIKLKGKNINLEGDYSLYEKGLVSGKFFMSLSQNSLKDSEKFKPLFRIIGRDMPVIDFDFQLSGLSGAMNFKWLESDFKKRLEKSLPGFVERGIEKKVEEAIHSISEQN